jgi:ligand-binding sensor domain-containing protein
MKMRWAGLGLAALAGVGGVVFLGGTLWNASRSFKEASALVAREGIVPFRSISLDRRAPGGFETISTPTHFRDAAPFNGRFYLCGAPGLWAFDINGTVVARYRPGLELPSAPLVAMAAGVGTGDNQPQLWIATAGEGLLAFDGHAFVQVRPDEQALRSITALLALSNGRVLLGTEKNGLLVWDGKNLNRYHSALSDLKVTAMAGTEADLWIGSMDRGVVHWHAGQLDHFGETEGVPDPRILCLDAHTDTVYAGTALGVAEFKGGKFTRVLASGSFANAVFAKDGAISIGTMDDGVLDVSTAMQTPRLQNFTRQADIDGVEKLFTLEDRLYALARGGLYEQGPQGGGFRKVLEMPGAVLADGNISALSVDRAGRLWTGYFDRGLDILEPGFERATHVEDQHVFCVNRIVHHPDGGLSAVGTANGLVMFDAGGHERQVLGKAEGLIANQVTDVLLSGTSRVPVITVATPAGITTIDASGTSSLYAFHGLTNNHVYALAASNSRLLAGTLGGLSILDSGVVKANFTTANSGLRHNWITAIAPVADEWFIGTYGAGVMKLDSEGRWSTFADWKSSGEINPNAMLVTDRAVYAGTLGKGLAIYSRGSCRWVFHTTGLPSLNVTALTAAKGYLYVGSDNGLVRIQESELLR